MQLISINRNWLQYMEITVFISIKTSITEKSFFSKLIKREPLDTVP